MITVSNFFSSDNYALNAVAFADGTLWDMAAINTLALSASEGDDNITGYAGADTLNALGGRRHPARRRGQQWLPPRR